MCIFQKASDSTNSATLSESLFIFYRFYSLVPPFLELFWDRFCSFTPGALPSCPLTFTVLLVWRVLVAHGFCLCFLIASETACERRSLSPDVIVLSDNEATSPRSTPHPEERLHQANREIFRVSTVSRSLYTADQGTLEHRELTLWMCYNCNGCSLDE